MLTRSGSHTPGWPRLWHVVRGSVRVSHAALCLLLLSAWPAQTWAQCTNCTTTLVGGDVVHIWIASGTFTPPAGVTSVQVLVVGGGGGGGFPIDRTGGGGGAGGLISNAAFAVAGTQTVTIGAGGNGGTSGSGATAGGNSVFGSLTAIGGGRGGTGPSAGGVYATTGGSGGGGYHNPSDSGKAGTAGQGNAGGSGYDSTNVTVGFKAGGGGGAGGAGTTATSTVNGAGGAGLQSSISGTATFYAGGGGGGIQVYTGTASGGSGVGGDGRANGLAGTAGMANRGGGGGGGSQNITTSATGNGGDGGSGIVIVRYSLSQSQTMSPGACTSLGGSGRNWTNPGNAVSSNNAYATSQTLDGTVTDPLQCLNFGFSIPLTATVNGIQVFVERKSSSAANGGSRDNSLFLVKAGASVGTDLATATVYTTADVIEAHGSSSEMWGTTWTPAQINAANFGTEFTAIKPSAAGGGQTVTVDHIFITVYYTISSPVVPPDSFNAVEVGAAVNGRIFTKLRGAGFNLDIVAILAGAQHATFDEAATIDFVTGGSGGANCGGAVTSVAGPANVTLSGGRATTAAVNITTAYPDVRVRIRYPAAGPYTITTCSSDNFSIKPTAFTITSTDATNTGTAAGAAIKTGANFNLTAAGGAGYTGTPSGNFAGNVTGTPTAGTIGGNFAAAVGGNASGTFYYSEVGNFGLGTDAVRDIALTTVSGDQGGGDCIASSTSEALSGGKYGCWVGSNAVAQTTNSSGFGRFIPDNFSVSYNTPVFASTCSGFSYVGQTFSYTTAPILTVIARNGTNNGLTNATTTNYAGSYMKFTNAQLAQAPYNTQAGRYMRFDALGGGNTPALELSGLPALTADPTISAFTSGVGTFTFGSGTGFLFTRSVATPSAPFNADIALALNVIDTDNVTFAGNPASFGTVAAAGNGIEFSDGNAGTTTDKLMRYGRLRVGSVNGSPLLPLRVPVEAQYWNGSAFITNIADTCTTLSMANIGLGNYILNPLIAGSGTTSVAAVTSPLSAGRSIITLNKPAANVRSVDVAVNLGSASTADACSGFAPAATAANKSYLRGNWCSPPGTHTKDPAARARFGIMRGSDEAIYTRENTN